MVLDDELQALVLLSSLPDSWDTLVVSLSNSSPQGVLTLDIVKDSMFNEEARRKEQDTCWIVDFGASFHVTSRRDFFTSYTNGDFGNVRMGNDKLSKIVGRRDISLETNTSCHLVLKDMRHVPDMRLNLISTGLLDDEGYTNVFVEGKWKLSKNSLVLARGKKENTLYMTHAKVSNGYVNALAEDSIELWHKRLGHMSEKGLQILAKREALTGMKKGMPLKSCTHCLARKHHRALFKHGHAQRKPNVLDVVYFDVCGPMTTSTLGGARYFVTFIDDHSRKTPQHNGIAERMNRTIVERIRTMLSHAKLPKSFWGEALMTVVDPINLSPSAPLNGDVPNKFWSGKDVSYNHLKVFGCGAFVHIPKDERSKLDAKSKECIFVGYGNEEFGYRGDKPDNPREYPSNLDPVPPPLEHNDGRDESNDIDDPASDPIINEPVDDGMSDDHTTDGIVDDIADEGLEAQAHEEPAAEFQPRRSTRVQRPPSRYSPDDYVLLTDGGEPECYEEALTHDQQDEWLKAMHEEKQSLHENHTYDLVNLPKDRKALKNKWVYRLKTEENNSKPRFKARLVVKGFSHKKGIDFEEIFSPVLKMSSIRVVLGLAASLNLEIEQLDVKTAFLHEDLEEEIYMEQPEGFKVKGREDLV
ncbi:unnamed protein product [Prunus brigantina]